LVFTSFLLCPVLPPALRALMQCGRSQGVAVAKFISFEQFHAAECQFVFLNCRADQACGQENLPARHPVGDLGTPWQWYRLSNTARAARPVAATGLARLPREPGPPGSRSGIVLGGGLFLSYTRPAFSSLRDLWILLIAFLTLAIRGGYSAAAVGTFRSGMWTRKMPAASGRHQDADPAGHHSHVVAATSVIGDPGA